MKAIQIQTKRLIVPVFFILLGFHAVAQNTIFIDNDIKELTMWMKRNSSTSWANTTYDPSIEGSPYLDNSFAKGMMVLKNDTMIRGIEYRYNIFNKQMEMIISGDTLALIHPEKVRSIHISNKTFIYDAFYKDDLNGYDYFEVLADGKVRLLLNRKVEFVPKNPPVTPMSVGYPNDRFVKSEYIFLQRAGLPATHVKSAKKIFLDFLEDHKEEIEKFTKEEKIRFNDYDDLVRLINFYNTLP